MVQKNDLLCFELANYLCAWNISVISCSKIWYYGNFCGVLYEFPMILADFLLPGSGRPKWWGTNRIRIHITVRYSIEFGARHNWNRLCVIFLDIMKNSIGGGAVLGTVAVASASSLLPPLIGSGKPFKLNLLKKKPCIC